MGKIAIIDYGAGNLRSVEKAFECVGGNVKIARTPADLKDAVKLVLPGVGAFGYAMERLEKSGLKVAVAEKVGQGMLLLGICLGKQLLVEESEESSGARGFGFIPGKVVRFAETLKVPHIGWNNAQVQHTIPLLANVPDQTFFYFIHSYYAQPASGDHVVAVSDYGVEFPCIIARDNVFGIQFHPEKSQNAGLQILKNFVGLS